MSKSHHRSPKIQPGQARLPEIGGFLREVAADLASHALILLGEITIAFVVVHVHVAVTVASVQRPPPTTYSMVYETRYERQASVSALPSTERLLDTREDGLT